MTKKEYVSGSETDEEPEQKPPPKKVEKVRLRLDLKVFSCSYFISGRASSGEEAETNRIWK